MLVRKDLYQYGPGWQAVSLRTRGGTAPAAWRLPDPPCPRTLLRAAMDVDHYLVSAARRAHRLREGRTYTMGREEGAEIHIQDAMISRRHAEIVSCEGGWAVRDLGSRNGTYVNGRRVSGEVTLVDQDRVQVGGQIYCYHVVPPGSDLGLLSSQAPRIADDATMAAGFTPGDVFASNATFSGAITEGGVLELLQFFANTRKTGRLDLLNATGGLVGSIALVDGRVSRAVLGMARLEGLDALVALLREACRRFAFHADAAMDAGPAIEGTAEGILMEAARRLDEG